MLCPGSACCSGGAPSSSCCFRGSLPSLSCMPCARCARCRSGGVSPSSALSLRAVVAHGLLRVAPSLPCLCTGSVRCWVGGTPTPPAPGLALWARAAGCGVPPSFPPLADAHIKRAQPFGGVSVHRLCLLACHALGERFAGFRPPPLYPSGPGLLSLLWPHGCPRSPNPPRRLDLSPSLLAPVSRTRGALARCARVWRRWFWWYAWAVSLRCWCPPS